jgi:hypothetical protein
MNARFAMADQVQLNTPLRSCAVKPLPVAEIENMRRNWFWNHPVISVYDAKRPEVTPMDVEETELRHPTKPKN